MTAPKSDPKRRKTGGRKAGTVNKRSKLMQGRIEELLESRGYHGMSLPELMVTMGLDEMESQSKDRDKSLALACFDKAAKYGYATLKAIEHSGELKTPPSFNVIVKGK